MRVAWRSSGPGTHSRQLLTVCLELLAPDQRIISSTVTSTVDSYCRLHVDSHTRCHDGGHVWRACAGNSVSAALPFADLHKGSSQKQEPLQLAWDSKFPSSALLNLFCETLFSRSILRHTHLIFCVGFHDSTEWYQLLGWPSVHSLCVTHSRTAFSACTYRVSIFSKGRSPAALNVKCRTVGVCFMCGTMT